MKILVVDDSITHAELCRLMLKMLGHQAEFAVNGVGALEQLSLQKFDCVLTDCLMPEMDGFTLAKEIRKEGSIVLNPCIYIIGMSGSTYEHPQQCMESGMNDFFEKPVNKNNLLIALEKAAAHIECNKINHT